MRNGFSSVSLASLLLLVASGTGLAQWNGEIVVWGSQHGTPSPNQEFVAVSAAGNCSVSDFIHYLCLKADGSIVCWGNNLFGQCSVPEPNESFVAVAAGALHSDAVDHCEAHSIGLKEDGTIVCWGSNGFGQCNVPPTQNYGFIAIAAGSTHSLGLKEDGSVVAWGGNSYGQCDVPEPNAGFWGVAAGRGHSLGLKADGSIVAWGWNYYGQCDVPEPNAGFWGVAAGRTHSLGLKEDGSIVAWGDNDYGQCNVPEPNQDFVAMACGGFWYTLTQAADEYVQGGHSLGLKADGSIVCWGSNQYGQCNVPEPNQDFVAVSSGSTFCIGLHSYDTGIWFDPALPDTLAITSVFPNPCKAAITIIFEQPVSGYSLLEFYDLSGRLVDTLMDGMMTAGMHSVEFDRSGLVSGVYLVRLTSGSECATAKVVLVR